MKRFSALVLFAAIIITFASLPACIQKNSSDDDATCSDAINNIWGIVENSSAVDNCTALLSLLMDPGIYWPGGSYYCGNNSGYDYYIPYEDNFKEDMNSWCEHGTLSNGDVIDPEGGWDQDAIDCNNDARNLSDLMSCNN